MQKTEEERERERERGRNEAISLFSFQSQITVLGGLLPFKHPHFQGKIENQSNEPKKVQILHAHSLEIKKKKKSEKQFKKRHKKRAEKEKECMTNSGLWWGRSNGH